MIAPDPAYYINVAASLASVTQRDVHERWVNVTLCGQKEFLQNSSETVIDLLLRSMEAETVARLKRNYHPADHHLTLQNALSKSWLLSWYEAVRCVQERAYKEAKDTKLIALRRKLELVRVPLAKMRIANDGRIKEPIQMMRAGFGPLDVQEYSHMNPCDYSPVAIIRSDTGSYAWAVYDSKTKATVEVSRREISDEILKIWGTKKTR